MHKIVASLIGASLLAAPAQAAEWRDQAAGIQPGVFVGAKLRLSLRGNHPAKPSASLTIAPAQSRISGDGVVSTRIGEGLALNFGPRSKPTLTLAGVRADTALGFRQNGDTNGDGKLGVSTGGWIAIGVGAAAAIVGGLYLAADHIADCDEGECD